MKKTLIKINMKQEIFQLKKTNIYKGKNNSKVTH